MKGKAISKTVLILPDPHSHPDFPSDRADWLAQFIIDIKPDIVVNMGDQADLASLSSYDKGKRSFYGKSYAKDITACQEFNSRLWDPVKATKKKTPYRIFLEGNHEHRIEKALDLSPELSGTIGFRDFGYEDYYHEIVRYEGGFPGVYKLDNTLLAHYFVTGVSGRPLGGERAGHLLLTKNGISCIAAHSHTFDLARRRTLSGRVLNGLVVGWYGDYVPDWAGAVGSLWESGVCVLRNFEDGNFDVEWVQLSTLRKLYGSPSLSPQSGTYGDARVAPQTYFPE